MSEAARQRARVLMREARDQGDATGWFERLYAEAHDNPRMVQWADMEPNPNLVAWLDRLESPANGARALVVGCGTGDDAEETARRGCHVVAFDIAPSAVAWSRRRFPDSSVDYTVADVLALPPAWTGAFDLVVEVYTLQVLPPDLRGTAMAEMARCLAPGGRLLVICRGRDPDDDPGLMPWPLTPDEIHGLARHGLRQESWEDYDEGGVRRFRACFGRPG